MVHELEMPQSLAGFRVKRHQGLGEQVVTGTVATVHVACSRFHGDVDDAPLLVRRHGRPGTGIAGIQVRVVAPGFGAEFTRLRNGMENPEHFPGMDVIAPDIARRSGLGAW